MLELLTASPSPQLTDALQQSYWNVAQHETQLELIQTRQGATEGIAAEGTLVTLIFDVKQTQGPTPPIQLVSVQLADSRTRAIPVDLVAEQVSMMELFPDKPMLMQNYPNPFNPETWIPYLPIRRWFCQFTIQTVSLSVDSIWGISTSGHTSLAAERFTGMAKMSSVSPLPVGSISITYLLVSIPQRGGW